ncbi:MAG TPA: hypothetical protein VKU02_27495 [Gemmataceae bacterium]|nr:hypothetical protein [Gemmataceae bacterium]
MSSHRISKQTKGDNDVTQELASTLRAAEEEHREQLEGCLKEYGKR